jgi:predicted aspartyl protease
VEPALVAGSVVTLPVVQVTASGVTRRALVDTGTTGVVISSSLLGVSDGATVVIDSICFGDVCTGALYALALDTPFSTPDGIQIIVGMSVLSLWQLEIDHDKRVRIGSLAGECDGPAVGFTLDATNQPTVSGLSVAGVAVGSAVVDTGGVYTLLAASTAAELPSAVSAGAVDAGLCTADGCTSGYAIVDAPEVCLGGACAASVAVKYPVDDSVGNSLLSRFRVRFDFGAKTLRFCDSASPTTDDAGDPEADATVSPG